MAPVREGATRGRAAILEVLHPAKLTPGTSRGSTIPARVRWWAVLYLVDGYNVTKGDPATARLSLESQRDELVARLRSRGEQLLGRGSIVVVFDGDVSMAQVGLRASATHPVEVVYSRGVRADDAIVERVPRGRRTGVSRELGSRACRSRYAQAHGDEGPRVRPRESRVRGLGGASPTKGPRRRRSRGGASTWFQQDHRRAEGHCGSKTRSEMPGLGVAVNVVAIIVGTMWRCSSAG